MKIFTESEFMELILKIYPEISHIHFIYIQNEIIKYISEIEETNRRAENLYIENKSLKNMK